MKSSRVGRIFSDELSRSSAHGKRFNRLKSCDGNGDDDSGSNPCRSNREDLTGAADSSSPSYMALSPMAKSPWSMHMGAPPEPTAEDSFSPNVLMGSLVREEGHIYSLAAAGELLYTGSDSKNIRVWKNQKEFSGFKCHSGLVKAIIITGEHIFSGHQDGKIRVWKISSKNDGVHKRVGTLPSLREYIKCSLRPSNYVEVRRHRSVIWIRHFDAISCLSLNEDKTLLYSASWDKTFKVWKTSNFKCIESVVAHDDAVNAIVTGFDGMVFTGSADGTVKVWRRELHGKGTKHLFTQTLLQQDCAVTALALNPEGSVIYCGSSDGLVNYWDREKQFSHGGVLRGHKLAVLCLITAGKLVLSGSADMGICVWRKEEDNHICLSVLTGHNGPVKCLAAEKEEDSTPSNPRWIVYSGSLDKSVKMWRVSERAPPMQKSGAGGGCPVEGNDGGTPRVLMYAPSFSAQGRISVSRKREKDPLEEKEI